MKYEILRNTMIQGKPCNVGDVVEVPANKVSELMAIGRIKEWVEPAPAPVVENRAEGVEKKAKPARRTYTRKKAQDAG